MLSGAHSGSSPGRVPALPRIPLLELAHAWESATRHTDRLPPLPG